MQITNNAAQSSYVSISLQRRLAVAQMPPLRREGRVLCISYDLCSDSLSRLSHVIHTLKIAMSKSCETRWHQAGDDLGSRILQQRLLTIRTRPTKLQRIRSVALACLALSGLCAYLRGYSSLPSLKTSVNTTSDAEWIIRRDEVKQAFVTSWSAYAEYAMGMYSGFEFFIAACQVLSRV